MQSCFKFSNVQTILLQSVRNAILLQKLLQYCLKCYKCNTPMLSGIAPWPPSVSCDLHKAKRMSSSGQGRLDQVDLSECQLEDCNGTGVFLPPFRREAVRNKRGVINLLRATGWAWSGQCFFVGNHTWRELSPLTAQILRGGVMNSKQPFQQFL